MSAVEPELTFTLRLTEPELKVTWSALCSFRDDLGHDQADVRAVVRAALAKFPDEHTMRATQVTPLVAPPD